MVEIFDDNCLDIGVNICAILNIINSNKNTNKEDIN